ncbi:HPP family protein [Candidatus Woesearchaeota archaeon]|nr:HPP family protein [Candidatus Woesearchaeota archaeon]
MKKLNKLKQYSLLFFIVGLMLITAFVILSALFNITDYGISAATIAASLFVIFSGSKSSISKNLFGSYIIAGICAFTAIYSKFPLNIECSLAVLLTIVTMLLINIKHTPAIGLSISFVLNQLNPLTILLVLLGIFLLFFIAQSFKKIISNPNAYLVKKDKIEFNFKQKNSI